MDVKDFGKGSGRALMLALAITSLVACKSAPKKEEVVSYDTYINDAEAQVGTVGSDAAIRIFEQAAKADPTRKEPWVRIAQLQFDQGKYARAIVAAEEVLQRDPTDIVADGVITVSGFRIANASLARLQGRGALGSETARVEAKTLADTLRSTMGDAVLEPPKPARPTRAARTTRAARATTAPATPAPAAAPAATPARSGGAASDPFKNIGN